METATVHIPVLLAEAMFHLAPRPGGIYVDCTLGAGGHARAILERIGPSGLLIGLDRDPQAIRAAGDTLAAYRGQVILLRENHANVDKVLEQLGITAVDGFIFDFGVSSLQVDTDERGFSFWRDAPLDMRMDPRLTTTAYHLVNGLNEHELAGLLRDFGGERWAARIARFIVRERQRARIETTGELVDLVKAAIPASARRRGGHPARRTFQALRIAVNDELGSLEQAVTQAVQFTRPGGRICAVSFHSLEDRLVKDIFRRNSRRCTCPPGSPSCRCGAMVLLTVLTPRSVTPGAAEVDANPRARSARLRAAERLAGELRVIKGGRSE